MTTLTIAFDRQSARSFDADGRMRVRDCILSTAEVNPYRGREIPGSDDLGLSRNDIYDLYRDPHELGAPDAIASFQGIPLMVKHIVQTADDPQQEYQAGSVHSVHFDGKHLRGDLLVSDGRAIDLIESDELSDLSCGYRYKPVMQSGEAQGKRFDGRMTEIRGNHVALVDNGRATNAHVADSALDSGEKTMAFPEQSEGASAKAPAPAPAAAPATGGAPAPTAAPAAAPAAGGDLASVGAAIKALTEQMAQQHAALLAAIQGQGAAAPGGMDADLKTEGEPNAVKGPKGHLNGGRAEDEDDDEGGRRERERAHEEGAEDEDDDEDDEGAMDENESGGAQIGEGGTVRSDTRENDGEPRANPASRGVNEQRQGGPVPTGNNESALEEVSGAMDAAMRSVVQKAVLRERARGRRVAEAKREVAAVLGGDIALDDAGTIYREALELVGVDVSKVKKGAERAAWQAAQAARHAAAGYRADAVAAMAMDSDATKEQRNGLLAKLGNIRVES